MLYAKVAKGKYFGHIGLNPLNVWSKLEGMISYHAMSATNDGIMVPLFSFLYQAS